VTTWKQPDPATDALRSLVGIEALSLLTSIHHLDQLDVAFLVPAVLLVGLPPSSCGGFSSDAAVPRA
jgi:hypothetical protein